MKLSTLRKQASLSTVYRGHRMRYGEPYGREGGPMSQNGECRDCGCHVWLVEDPAPNSLRISGTAVALNCQKPILEKTR